MTLWTGLHISYMAQSIIIIIGLPGSGKTTFAKTQYSNQYLISDDFIQTFCNGHITKAIKANNPVCLIDPRLCDFATFNRYMTKLELGPGDINLILFENDPVTCLQNAKSRNDNRLGIEQTIESYSKIYSLDNYLAYDPIILPCWKPIIK